MSYRTIKDTRASSCVAISAQLTNGLIDEWSCSIFTRVLEGKLRTERP